MEKLQLTSITPDPGQPRTEFDPTALNALGADISENGQLTPIIVRPDPEDKEKYIIVCGERRFRAHLGNKTLSETGTILADVKEDTWTQDPLGIFMRQISENDNRSDLGPMEQVRAWARGVEMGLAVDQIATASGRPTHMVEKDLTLMGLPEHVQDFVANGKCPKSAAHVIAALPTKKRMSKAWAECANQGTATKMIAAVEAYEAATSQEPLHLIYDEKEKKKVGKDVLKQAGKAYDAFYRAVAKFQKSDFSSKKIDKVLLARDRKIEEIETLAITMTKLAKELQKQATAFRASKRYQKVAKAA